MAGVKKSVCLRERLGVCQPFVVLRASAPGEVYKNNNWRTKTKSSSHTRTANVNPSRKAPQQNGRPRETRGTSMKHIRPESSFLQLIGTSTKVERKQSMIRGSRWYQENTIEALKSGI
ncbi:predicted protein [Nematostella vectensis]|uniref:Uncharacterized protein n=1 Tax=Nematostella vectensis TaxID=45351 RepID=A7RUP5_NEMVE|nr:predicted protein [Nematostella vectensis]|eukprot:XP_001636845.1 predicted protein [Nematostella vectensis]